MNQRKNNMDEASEAKPSRGRLVLACVLLLMIALSLALRWLSRRRTQSSVRPPTGLGQTGTLGDRHGKAEDLVGQGTAERKVNGGALCVRVALSPSGSYVGPLTVTGYTGKRCMGAWNVVAGTSEAFFGVTEAGPVRIVWQFPGGKTQEMVVVVEDGPVRVVIGGE